MPSLTEQPEPLALTARYVFPVAGEPIPNGIVTIHGERILRVGHDTPARDVRDLGNAAIVPGLVNAHGHLEFSELDRPLGKP
ncbi:MAG: amidohydrolase family protein, partial [Planctomycetota bacterium]